MLPLREVPVRDGDPVVVVASDEWNRMTEMAALVGDVTPVKWKGTGEKRALVKRANVYQQVLRVEGSATRALFIGQGDGVMFVYEMDVAASGGVEWAGYVWLRQARRSKTGVMLRRDADTTYVVSSSLRLTLKEPDWWWYPPWTDAAMVPPDIRKVISGHALAALAADLLWTGDEPVGMRINGGVTLDPDADVRLSAHGLLAALLVWLPTDKVEVRPGEDWWWFTSGSARLLVRTTKEGDAS